MDKIKIYHYGCSFTENFIGYGLEHLFDSYDYINSGKNSYSNFKIFDEFEHTVTNNSIAIIQWSSITRPNDDNFSLMETSDNPLFDMLEQWYVLLEKTQIIVKSKNIKLIQYIGWAHWKDDELTDYHRDKLKSFGIHWFQSEKTTDIIQSNCFQFEDPPEWSSHELPNGQYIWSKLHWGGMAEWIRTNVEVNNRYFGYFEHEGERYFDVHPSKFATEEFTKRFLIPFILKKIE
jgi:hypothetical protein